MSDISSTNLDGEISKKFDQFAGATKQALDSLKTEHTALNTAFDGWSNKSADLLKEVNDLKETKSIQDNIIKTIETQLSRPNVGAESNKYKMVEEKEKFADFLRSSSETQMMNSTRDYQQKHIQELISVKYPQLVGQKLEIHTKNVIETILPDGGYWVLPDDFSSKTVTRFFETSPMRQVAGVINTAKKAVVMVIDDEEVTGLTTGGELTPVTPSNTPQVGQLTIDVNQVSADVRVSDYMLEDATFDIADWVLGKAARKITRTQNTAFINGGGSLEARGVLNYSKWTGAAVVVGDDSNYTRFKLEYIKSQDAAELKYDGLINLQNALIEEYQSDSAFMMHRTSWGAILRLKDGDGRPLFQFMDLLKTGADNMPLLGRNVIFASDLAQPDATGAYAANAAPIIYGDFSVGYTIVDRIGMNVLRDIYTQASNNLVKFLTKTRYGGGVTNFQALKVLEIAA